MAALNFDSAVLLDGRTPRLATVAVVAPLLYSPARYWSQDEAVRACVRLSQARCVMSVAFAPSAGMGSIGQAGRWYLSRLVKLGRAWNGELEEGSHGATARGAGGGRRAAIYGSGATGDGRGFPGG